MAKYNVFEEKFAVIHSLYVKKVERKGRTAEEVDAVTCWLTGYRLPELHEVLAGDMDLQTFFDRSPAFNPASSQIKGKICGVQIETIEDPLMKKVRYLDKLVDELAQGKALEKILRT